MRTIFDRQAVESEWVFTGNVRREHLKEPKKPGLPTPHRLRATWATRAAELGCPVPVMAALLNHSVKSQNITLRYATPSDGSLVEWAQRVADSLWSDID
jgi:integrase